MMKLFNPFKPHIALNRYGQYVIRKLSILDDTGWMYMYSNTIDWYLGPSSYMFRTEDIEEARKVLKQYNLKNTVYSIYYEN